MHVPSNYERKPNDGDSALQTPLSATRTTPSAAAPTQMIIFPIKATASIEDISTPDGQIWAGALDILEGSTGFQRMYWGRHVEDKGRTQLHVGSLSPTLFHVAWWNTTYQEDNMC